MPKRGENYRRGPCFQPGRPSLSAHEQVIRKLVDRDKRVCRRGFRAAVDDLIRELAADDPDFDEFPEYPSINFVPDAYLIDRKREMIVIFEVEDTHRIPKRKLDAIAALWFWFDSEGQHDWWPELVLVNNEGVEMGKPDLVEAYWAMCDRRVRQETVGAGA